MKPTTIQIPESDEWILGMRQKARFNIEKYEGCTQSILQPFMETGAGVIAEYLQELQQNGDLFRADAA